MCKYLFIVFLSTYNIPHRISLCVCLRVHFLYTLYSNSDCTSVCILYFCIIYSGNWECFGSPLILSRGKPAATQPSLSRTSMSWGRGGSVGRAPRSNGIHDQRFESRPSGAQGKIAGVFPSQNVVLTLRMQKLRHPPPHPLPTPHTHLVGSPGLSKVRSLEALE